VGRDALLALVARERRLRGAKGETLARRMAALETVIGGARWRNPAALRAVLGSADFVGDRVVLDVCGNSYRAVLRIDHRLQIAEVRFAGDHAEYDRIDVRKA
jgi:mRNA interferase HigB